MSFLEKPGSPGGFGALLDEYARAAEDFCTVVERFDPAAFGFPPVSFTPGPSLSDTSVAEAITQAMPPSPGGF